MEINVLAGSQYFPRFHTWHDAEGAEEHPGKPLCCQLDLDTPGAALVLQWAKGA